MPGSDQQILDQRLFCNCGEIAEVKALTAAEDIRGRAGYRVFCKKDGLPCCMTQWGETPEEAILYWEAMNQEEGL